MGANGIRLMGVRSKRVVQGAPLATRLVFEERKENNAMETEAEESDVCAENARWRQGREADDRCETMSEATRVRVTVRKGCVMCGGDVCSCLACRRVPASASKQPCAVSSQEQPPLRRCEHRRPRLFLHLCRLSTPLLPYFSLSSL